MNALPVILIFDVGKTNKKLLLFNEQYKLVHEESTQLPEIEDEDGFPCEDINALTKWIWESHWKISNNKNYNIRGINFSGYGASFVHLNDYYKPFTPLYSYLKPYPDALLKQFYGVYGGEALVTKETASPVLGNLNSGMQLYWLKYEKPEIFSRIKYSLHLPQYLSFIISSKAGTDITSIGCHTHLWDFSKHDYHDWVYKESIRTKFAPLYNGDELIGISKDQRGIPVGVGLHDSSAALIPYLTNFHEPFILLSTGTWCISLNPFNQSPLTENELRQDCLCYLSYQGKPVKASRLFAGHEHEQQTKRLADHYNKSLNYYSSVACDMELVSNMQIQQQQQSNNSGSTSMIRQSPFAQRDLSLYKTYEAAYHQLIADLINQQLASTNLVLQGTDVKRIFVDGGFSKNPVYMHLLAKAFPEIEVFAASVAQATALGAALSIHKQWNDQPLPGDLIELKYYAVGNKSH